MAGMRISFRGTALARARYDKANAIAANVMLAVTAYARVAGVEEIAMFAIAVTGMRPAVALLLYILRILSIEPHAY